MYGPGPNDGSDTEGCGEVPSPRTPGHGPASCLVLSQINQDFGLKLTLFQDFRQLFGPLPNKPLVFVGVWGGVLPTFWGPDSLVQGQIILETTILVIFL